MRIGSYLDPFIIPVSLGLSGISLFLLISTTQTLFWQQLISFLIGLAVFIIFSSIDYRIWPKIYWHIYFLSIILLLITFFSEEVRGSTRWIEIFGLSLQTSELIKPFIIIVLVSFFSRKKPKNLFYFLSPMLMMLPLVLMIFKQPDLGNVLIYMTILFCLEIASGLPIKYIFIGSIVVVIFLPAFWFILKTYQQQRLISFLNPNTDPIGTGYNALQAMIAIGSGQFFGLGLGRGSQSRLLFLPEYHTDFVFAALVEALGFFGGLLVIFLYALLLGRILMVVYIVKDNYAKLLAIGIFAQLFIQIFINIGMNIGILPITGITLPLISYGGNSIISTFINLGILVSILRIEKKDPLVIS